MISPLSQAGESPRGHIDHSQAATGGPVSFSHLLRIKHTVGSQKHVTDKLLRDVVAEVCCQRRTGTDEEERVCYELQQEA